MGRNGEDPVVTEVIVGERKRKAWRRSRRARPTPAGVRNFDSPGMFDVQELEELEKKLGAKAQQYFLSGAANWP